MLSATDEIVLFDGVPSSEAQESQATSMTNVFTDLFLQAALYELPVILTGSRTAVTKLRKWEFAPLQSESGRTHSFIPGCHQD